MSGRTDIDGFHVALLMSVMTMLSPSHTVRHWILPALKLKCRNFLIPITLSMYVEKYVLQLYIGMSKTPSSQPLPSQQLQPYCRLLTE